MHPRSTSGWRRVLPLPPGIALDLLLLEEKRQASSPRSAPRGKIAPPWLQQGCWPLGARAYLSGLVADGHPGNVFCGPGRPMSACVRAKSAGQRTPGPDGGADRPGGPGIGKILVQIPSQADSPRQSCSCPAPGGARRTTAPGRPSQAYACGGVSSTPPNH